MKNVGVAKTAVQWDGNADTANKILGESYGVDWWYSNGRIAMPGNSNNNSDIIFPASDGTMKRCCIGDWLVSSNNAAEVARVRERNLRRRVLQLDERTT